MTGKTLGAALRDERLRRGMTQEEVAAELGVGQSRYNTWEKDRNTPDVDAWPALVKFLRTDRPGFAVLYLNQKERLVTQNW